MSRETTLNALAQHIADNSPVDVVFSGGALTPQPDAPFIGVSVNPLQSDAGISNVFSLRYNVMLNVFTPRNSGIIAPNAIIDQLSNIYYIGARIAGGSVVSAISVQNPINHDGLTETPSFFTFQRGL